MPFSSFLQLFNLQNLTGFIQNVLSSNNELIMALAGIAIGIYIIIMADSGEMGSLT